MTGKQNALHDVPVEADSSSVLFHINQAAPYLAAALVAYATIRGVISAASRPFLADEVITWSLTRLSSFSELWKALSSGADAQPPLFYLVEKAAATFVSNPHLAYRLPSIVAFSCAVLCIFVCVKKRSSAAVALLCAAALIPTGLCAEYAVEARPYCLTVAAIAFALVCYQRLPSISWTILLFAALALAVAFHYYAVFPLAAFAAAEAVFVFTYRRWRWAVWLAIIAAGLPLLPCLPLLRRLREVYGPHIWAHAHLYAAMITYGSFFKVHLMVGLGAAALLAAGLLSVMRRDSKEARGPASAEQGLLHEHTLLLLLLVMPFIVCVAARVSHGAFLSRYVLWVAVAMLVALGYLVPRFGPRGTLALGIYVAVAILVQEGLLFHSISSHFARVISPGVAIDQLVQSAGHAELPVVIGNDNFVVAYYIPQPSASRYVSLVDMQQAIAYTGTDNVDQLMFLMRPYLPTRVVTFDEFAPAHRAFLLYSDGNISAEGNVIFYDWWTPFFIHQGYSVRVLAADHNRRVYLVNLDEKAN